MAAIFAKNLEREVRAIAPPVDDERADTVPPADGFGQVIEDRRLRAAVAVDDDDVLEAVADEAGDNVTQVGAIGGLGDGEGAGVTIETAGDSVGHHRRDERVEFESHAAGDVEGRGDVGAVVRYAVGFESAGGEEDGGDLGRDEVTEFHPIDVAHFACGLGVGNGDKQ